MNGAPLLGRAQFWILMCVAMAAAVCWAFFGPLPPSVTLLTGNGPFHHEAGIVGCYTNFAVGELVLDPAYGTAIVENDKPTPIMWPEGYTGRQSIFGVEVVDELGHVVARTGTRVQIEGAYSGVNPISFLACGYVLSR
jgi:hypothetical protein